MQHGGGGDGGRRGGAMDVMYHITVCNEPAHQTSPFLGEVISGDQYHLFARTWELGTAATAAEPPRANKRRVAVNLIGNIITSVFVRRDIEKWD